MKFIKIGLVFLFICALFLSHGCGGESKTGRDSRSMKEEIKEFCTISYNLGKSFTKESDCRDFVNQVVREKYVAEGTWDEDKAIKADLSESYCIIGLHDKIYKTNMLPIMLKRIDEMT